MHSALANAMRHPAKQNVQAMKYNLGLYLRAAECINAIEKVELCMIFTEIVSDFFTSFFTSSFFICRPIPSLHVITEISLFYYLLNNGHHSQQDNPNQLFKKKETMIMDKLMSGEVERNHLFQRAFWIFTFK